MEIENKNCEILLDDTEKVICCFDRAFFYNLKPFSTNNKENYEKAKEYLRKSFTEETDYKDVLDLVVDFNMEPTSIILYNCFKNNCFKK